ncbi:MAG: HAD family hydrolase [Anaerolineaceae bacterium]|nr:HAD family hydrolase [Anaerolineaceae bacterium]
MDKISGPIKGIIFDLGGTLIEITRQWDDIIREGAEAMTDWYVKKRRIKFDSEALIDAFIEERYHACETARATQTEISAQKSLQRALKQIQAPAAAEAAIEGAIKVLFSPEEAAYQLFPDAIDTIKKLKAQGCRLGLYSNATDDKLVQRLVNRNGLRPYLSPTFSSAGCGWRKPKPEPFSLIARRWNLPPAQVAVVGDTLGADILGAQNAGMIGILIQRSNPAAASPIQPAATINQLAELTSLIRPV